jgi:PAS domain S-box-containing protein
MTLSEDPDGAVAAHELSETVQSTESTTGPIPRHGVETSEARFRSIFDSTTRGLLLLGSDGEPRIANAAFTKLFAIDDVEPLTLSAVKQRCVSGGQFSKLQERLEECLAGGSSRFDVTIDVRRGTGAARRHLSARCNPVIAGGSIDGVLIEFTELTEQVHARLDEERSRARMEAAQRIAQLGHWEQSLRTGAITWSDELYRILDLDPAQEFPSAERLHEAVHADDRQRVMAVVHDALAEKQGYEIRYRIGRSNGSVRVVDEVGEISLDSDGKPLRLLGVVHDVTEQVSAQQALVESEARFRFAQSIAHVGSWGRSLKRADGYWSDEFFRLLGLEPGSIEPSRGNFLKYMHPDDRATFLELADSASEGYDLRLRFIGADGVERILWMHGELTRGEDGEPLRWDGTGQDVSELVAAERALEESESRINLVFDSVGTGLAIIGPDRRALVVNRACSEILGYPAEELTAVPFDHLVHPDDLAMTLESFQQRLEGVPVLQERVDTRLIHADGRVVEADLRAVPFRVGDTIVGVLAEFRDVTVESALHRQVAESAEQIDAILEATPDALIVADDDDVILRTNAATKEIFGWEPEALVGQPVSILVGGPDRAAHAEYVDYYKQTGKASTPEGLAVGNFRGATGRRADGSDFPVELAVAETGTRDGRKLFVAAIRDVSERQAAEEQVGRLNAEVARRSQETQALMQQLLTAQEEERRTVAYDIHDGPAQQLAAAQMFLQAFIHDAAIVPAEAPNLAKAKQHLEEGLNETRRIMSGLRPAMLDDLGLEDALRQLLVEVTEQAGVQLEFDSNGLEVGLPPTVEITLYRVAQEAVSNALKHSGSRHLVVRLTSARDGVRLEVQDRGVGFNTTSVRSPSEGKRFGLVGMRERVTLLGGAFEIESRPGEGATVRVEIPFSGGK